MITNVDSVIYVVSNVCVIIQKSTTFKNYLGDGVEFLRPQSALYKLSGNENVFFEQAHHNQNMQLGPDYSIYFL